MSRPDPKTFTRLLHGVREGRSGAAQSLLEFVYDELQVLSRAAFASESKGHTLQPTALIHEAWLKLTEGLGALEGRQHFFAAASRAMRQVLTDHARRRRSQKRGGAYQRVTLLDGLALSPDEGFDLVDLEDSLTRLASMNERHARVVELRILGGLTIAETAEALDVSHFTVEEDWFMAKAWLRTELAGSR